MFSGVLSNRRIISPPLYARVAVLARTNLGVVQYSDALREQKNLNRSRWLIPESAVHGQVGNDRFHKTERGHHLVASLYGLSGEGTFFRCLLGQLLRVLGLEDQITA